MKSRIAGAVKSGLHRTGHYARTLANDRFPGVAVLGYHGLRDDGWPDGAMPFENLHVRASIFAEHCRVIRDTCDPITLDDWHEAAAGGVPLPPRPVLITFDDGYRSVFTLAAPILAAHALPALVFACSGPIEARTLLWFDQVASRDGEDAVEQWKGRPYVDWRDHCVANTAAAPDDPRALMTPDELRSLSRQHGIEIGAHTVRHPILANATASEQESEIAADRRALERLIERPVRAFAYPNGRRAADYTDETVRIVGACGFDAAFTTRPAFATPDESPLERSRFTMLNDVSATELVHRLTYSWRD